jgi:hypothetical protein
MLRLDPAWEESFKMAPVRLEPGQLLESLIGKRVDVIGVVSGVSTTQIQGIDVPGLDEFRGKQVLVSGVLQRNKNDGGESYRLEYLTWTYAEY